MTEYDDIGIAVPEILLPRPGTDLKKWSVIACDQYTSEPDYWERVRDEVGNSPSTLNLVLPEIYLEAPDKQERIDSIQATMREYLGSGLLEPRRGMLFVERHMGNKVRRGLLLCLDLERYDYAAASEGIIRASEGTILERLPPRMAIREGAALELPHILVLIDDPARTVIEPLQSEARNDRPIYDFDLMFDSGRLTGFGIAPEAEQQVVGALRALAVKRDFRLRYDLSADAPVLLFAMGDGNHSLATAKAVWEKIKPAVGMDHPARYALVEVENVHDEGLDFEPIHRILFGVKGDLWAAMHSEWEDGASLRSVKSAEEMQNTVDSPSGRGQVVGMVRGSQAEKYAVIEISRATSNLAVGTVQSFLDGFLAKGGAERIDYVHGGKVVERLGAQTGNAAFYMPKMGKSELFKTVILDGALPRKTFSMGAAREKRFYMEARKIA